MQAPEIFGKAEGDALSETFFIETLKNYCAEKELLMALQIILCATTTGELNNAIGEHLTQTEGYV